MWCICSSVFVQDCSVSLPIWACVSFYFVLMRNLRSSIFLQNASLGRWTVMPLLHLPHLSFSLFSLTSHALYMLHPSARHSLLHPSALFLAVFRRFMDMNDAFRTKDPEMYFLLTADICPLELIFSCIFSLYDHTGSSSIHLGV